MNSFSKKEISLIKKLNTPVKVQDYLNKLKFNFENNGIDVIKSPLFVIREGNAHCIEGAILGAYILSLHGYKPLIMHLQATKDDFDHVVALFKENGCWGAISKTNHAVLRYREPVYKSIHELVMSYFHEYFLNSNGKKTLRRYSKPLNLNIFEKGWEVESENIFGIDDELDKIKHYDVLSKNQIKKLRFADIIERKTGDILEFNRPSKN